jgi:hypothetical protein
MIPRDNVWPLGTGILAIDMSAERLFPLSVSAAQYSSKSCDSIGKDSISSPTGPCIWAEDTLGLASLPFLASTLPD